MIIRLFINAETMFANLACWLIVLGMTCSEGDVCKKLLGYIMVTFDVICVYFPRFHFTFRFFFSSGSHF